MRQHKREREGTKGSLTDNKRKPPANVLLTLAKKHSNASLRVRDIALLTHPKDRSDKREKPN